MKKTKITMRGAPRWGTVVAATDNAHLHVRPPCATPRIRHKFVKARKRARRLWRHHPDMGGGQP